jgi:hypothetical protein
MNSYRDDYPTCAITHVTVRIYDVAPERVSEVLGVIATKEQPAALASGAGVAARPHAWFLSSEDVVESRDVRRHLDWCLDQLVSRRDALEQLRREGARVDVICCWVSASGHGGPTVSPSQAGRLAQLNLDCGFDFYVQ